MSGIAVSSAVPARRGRWLAALASCLLVSPLAAVGVGVVDDAGRTVAIDRPVRRVVTLAPSLTELVFAAGGGAALVGVAAYSDSPDAARRIERIGDATRIDVERVLALRPDLVLVWQRGATSRELAQLEAAGLALFQLEPRRLDEVARAIERLGLVLGHAEEAAQRAGEMRSALAALRASHAGASPVRVFYQVWNQPLMTVNGRHPISEVIALCGGHNVFAGLASLIPSVSTEAVVAVDPEAFFTASEAGGGALIRRDPAAPSFAAWQRHGALSAVRKRWLYTLDGDAISRPGPRIVEGAGAVCAALDEVRRERAAR